jgi:hypothetical protein
MSNVIVEEKKYEMGYTRFEMDERAEGIFDYRG